MKKWVQKYVAAFMAVMLLVQLFPATLALTESQIPVSDMGAGETEQPGGSGVTRTQTGSNTFTLPALAAGDLSYTLTATSGPGGIISPAGTFQVSAGANELFAIMPQAEFVFAQLLVDGVSVTPTSVGGGVYEYEFVNVQANHQIHATFKHSLAGHSHGVQLWKRWVAVSNGNTEFSFVLNNVRIPSSGVFSRQPRSAPARESFGSPVQVQLYDDAGRINYPISLVSETLGGPQGWRYSYWWEWNASGPKCNICGLPTEILVTNAENEVVQGRYYVRYTINESDTDGQKPADWFWDYTAGGVIPSYIIPTGPVPSRPGYTFAGWEYNYRIYQPGDSVNLPISDIALVAKWTEVVATVNVTYAPGAQGRWAPEVYSNYRPGSSRPGPRVDPTDPANHNPGYSFAGWSDGTATYATTGALPATVTVSTTYTALWKAKDDILVTFNKNHTDPDETGWTGINPDPASKSVTFDAAYGALAAASRYGYTFAGWYTTATGGTQVTAATIVTNADNHTLYAHWTPKTGITVTFDKNHADPDETGWTGINPNPASKPVTFGAAYDTLATASMYGYTFAGWYTDATDGAQVEASTRVANENDHTLYALWTPKTGITVTFSKNHTDPDATGWTGINPNPASKQVTFASAYGDLATASRYGYVFDGWHTTATGGTKVDDKTLVANELPHTLYAHWTPKTGIKVTFEKNTSDTVTELTPPSKAVTFDAEYGTLPKPVRTGYNFGGWYTEAIWRDGLTEVTTDTIVKNPDDHTLYALWAPDIVNVSFNKNATDATNPMDPTGTTPMPSKDVNYGLLYGPLATTSRHGYTFGGWYTEDVWRDGLTEVTADTIVTIPANHTLHARWTANSYTVTFNKNTTDTVAGPTPAYKTVTFDAAYGPLANISRAGYNFGGWFLNAACTDPVDPVTPATVVKNASNHELYAKWTEKNSYTVKYNSNGGSPTPPDAENVRWTQADLVPTALVSRTGYELLGWNTAANGSGVSMTDTTPYSSLVHGNDAVMTVTLYAQWSPRNVKVMFYLNHFPTDTDRYDAGENANATKRFNEVLASFAAPSRPGYLFGGWYDSRTGGNRYTPDVSRIDAFTINPLTQALELHLYAMWVPDPNTRYTVYHNQENLAGGGYTRMNTDHLTGTTGTPPTYVRQNYPGFRFDSDDIAGKVIAADGSTVVNAYYTRNQNTPYRVEHYQENLIQGRYTLVTADLLTGTTGAAPAYAPKAYVGFTYRKSLDQVVDRVGSNETPQAAPYVIDGRGTTAIKLYYQRNRYDIAYEQGTHGTWGIQTHRAPFGALTPAFNGDPNDMALHVPGWRFTRWEPAVDRLVKINGATYVARWVERTYKVHYNSAGGLEHYPSKTSVLWGDANLLPANRPTRPGFAFAGWYSDPENGFHVSNSTPYKGLVANDSVESATLYARWTPKPYTVRYNTNGGTPQAIPDKTLGWLDTHLPSDDVVTRRGYVFDGWYTSRNAGILVDGHIPFCALVDYDDTVTHLTLYAHWVRGGQTTLPDELVPLAGTSIGLKNTTVGFCLD